MVTNPQGASITLPRDHATPECRIELPHLTFAPVTDASRHGQLVFLCDTDGDGLKEEIATLPLHAKYGVDALAPPNIFERILAFLRRIFS